MVAGSANRPYASTRAIKVTSTKLFSSRLKTLGHLLDAAETLGAGDPAVERLVRQSLGEEGARHEVLHQRDAGDERRRGRRS